MTNAEGASAVEHAATIDFHAVSCPVERARLLGPAIRETAEATEATGNIVPETVDLLRKSELFFTMVPTELGGLGSDVVTQVKVIEELSFHDGSTGWSTMAPMSVTGFAGGYLTDVGAKAIFGDGELSVIAGMFAPMGKVTPVEGGYLAGGRYSFGSGSGHADWIGGGAKAVDEDGPYDLIYLVPKDRAELKGNWSVLGLSGSGSYDYQIPEQFVSSDFVLRRAGGTPLRGQASQRLGLQVLGSAGHAGVALGIARRALQELHGVLSGGKVRPGAVPVMEQQLFLHEFACQEAKLSSARAFVLEAFGEALATAEQGDPMTELEYQRIRQCSTWITSTAMEVVNFAYLWSGSAGLREPGAMARCLRDMHAATQHVYVDSTTMVNAAPAVLNSYAKA